MIEQLKKNGTVSANVKEDGAKQSKVKQKKELQNNC
jgi:hypothetical protein